MCAAVLESIIDAAFERRADITATAVDPDICARSSRSSRIWMPAARASPRS
jgi:hypothetical protein